MNALTEGTAAPAAEFVSVPQAVLDAMVYPAAVLDTQGVIRRANTAWRRRADAVAGAAYAGFAAGLTDLLNGARTHFVHTYPCPSPDTPAWYQLIAAPIVEQGRIQGLLVQHVDVTRASTQDLERLTRRERTILMGIVDGMSNKAIARRDGVSESAVKLHLRGIFQKLGVANRTQAAMRGEHLMLAGAESMPEADAESADPAA